MNDYNFGNFVYELRTEKGLSQSELGRLVGVSNKAVSKWEVGAAKPRPEKLAKLAEIFGVTVEELLLGKRKERAEEASEIAFAIDMLIREYRRARKGLLGGIVCFFAAPVLMLLVLLIANAMGALESVWAGVLMGVLLFLHFIGEVTAIASFILMVKRKRTLYASFPRRREEVSARSHTIPPAKKRGKLGLIVLLCYLLALIVLTVALYAAGAIGDSTAGYLIPCGALAFGIGNVLFTRLWLRRVNRRIAAREFERAEREGKFLLETWLPDGRSPLCDAFRLLIAIACFSLRDDENFRDYLGEISVRAYLPAKSYWSCMGALSAGDREGFRREYAAFLQRSAALKGRVKKAADLYGERLRLFSEMVDGTSSEGTMSELLALVSNPRVQEIVRSL